MTYTCQSSDIIVSPGDYFAAEANHRIANNISMIAKLVATHGRELGKKRAQLSGGDVRQSFDELAVRLNVVAELHRRLAMSADTPIIDLAAYLESIAMDLAGSLAPTGKITLRVAFEGQWHVRPEKALPLGLMVAELVTNAVKYAHPADVSGIIALECRSDSAGGLIAEVADDGVGLPEGLDPSKSGQTGFRLLRSLAEQIGASLSFHSGALGLRVKIHAPALASMN